MRNLFVLIAVLSFFSSRALAQSPAATPPPADNTKQNATDRSNGRPTADDQPNDQADLKLLQAIRKSVIAEQGLSVDAKNCKILVSGGAVVLRGPVDSEKERQRIVEIASEAAGKRRVTNELTVKETK